VELNDKLTHTSPKRLNSLCCTVRKGTLLVQNLAMELAQSSERKDYSTIDTVN